MIRAVSGRVNKSFGQNVSRAEGARLAINFSTGRACVSHASDVLGARRVRNDNFSSTIVQRLNAGERNIPSLVQRVLSVGLLVGLA